MTEVEIGIYTHRWSQFQVNAIQSIGLHTRGWQYSIVVVQKPGTSHQNMNRLWSRFTAPYAVLMDEDVTVLQDNWLDGLIQALEFDAKLGVVGCSECKSRPPHIMATTSIQLSYRKWIPAYVMAFKRERVPFLKFDEAIPGQMGMTDLDACLQIRDAGLDVAVNNDVVVYHPARDDDQTRLLEARPRLSEQRSWYPAQVAYMRQKWGDAFAKSISI